MAGTHVDYENSLNNAIARLRGVIGAHRIATVSKRGYRLVLTRGARKDAAHPQAELAYRKGKHFWGRTTAADLLRSVNCFQDAVAADPGHARAYAGLAHAYIMLGDEVSGRMDPREALSHARAAAEQALALSSDNAEALAAIGMVVWRLNWDWDAAEDHLRAAIAIDPNYAIGHQYYSWLCQARKRTRESIAAILKARELAPLSPFVNANVAWMLYTSGRFAEAVEHISEGLALEPYYALSHLPLGLSLQKRGHLREAIFWLRRGAALAGENSPYYQAALGQALGAARDPSAGRGLTSDSSPFEHAMVHVGLGESGPALDCLEQARGEGSSHLSYMLVDPMFDSVRQDQRFRRLAQSVGLD